VQPVEQVFKVPHRIRPPNQAALWPHLATVVPVLLLGPLLQNSALTLVHSTYVRAMLALQYSRDVLMVSVADRC
jgi:hypothetical protein